MLYKLSKSSKSLNKQIDKYNFNEEISTNKLLKLPTQNKNLLNFSKDKRNSRFHSSLNINNINNPLNIQEKIEQYQLHPFRRVNLKLIGEGIKQKLLEMNAENQFEKEKTMSSPGNSRKLTKLFMEKYNIKMSDKNLSKLSIPRKSIIEDNNNKGKSLVAVHNPNFEFFEHKKDTNILKNSEKNKSCNNLIKLIPIKEENEKNNINQNNIEKSKHNKNLDNFNIKAPSSKKNLVHKYFKDEKYRYLKKVKLLYDSLDDHESDGDNDIGDVLNPESKFILFFDLLIILFYFYTFFIITFNLAESKCFCPSDNKYTFNDIIFYFNDLLYISDLIISFFRCYYNFEYKLIKNNILIIKNYLTGDFFFDLLEAIPVFSISKYICRKNNIYTNCYIYEIPSNLMALKMASILKSIKIFKILGSKKNQALDNFYELISENYTLERTTELIINSLLFSGIIHCFVCFHIFIGKHSFSNWLKLTNSENESLFFIYIESLYFLVTTLTTVGYGDITCKSFEERIFQIILLAVGSIFYSYIISTIGNFIKNDSHAKIKYNDDLNILENIRIAYPNMPFKLYRNINKYLESKSSSQEKYDVNSLIDTLPFTLKNSILFTMYKSAIKNFKFFKKNDNSEFIARILTNFISVISKRNAFLIYEGEMVEEIIFIKDGKISLNAAISLEDPSKSINKYFNENFTPFTSDEEKKLFGSKADNMNTGYVSTMNASITYDKAKNKINNAFNILKGENNNDEKSILQINKEEKSNFNDPCKFDINGGAIKNEDGSYQYLKILDIRKNEHFGCVYMTLQKPCPLTLQVKSKFAELYFLKKEDAISTSKCYPNIWKKLYGREFHNMKSIKDLTFKALRKYIELNQLLINLNLDDAITVNDLTINDLNILEKSICAEKSIALYQASKKSINQKKISPQNNNIARFKTMNNEFDKKKKRLSLGVIIVQKDKQLFKKKNFIRNQSNSIICNNINKEKILQLVNNPISSNKRIKPKIVHFADDAMVSKSSKNENIMNNNPLIIKKISSSEIYSTNEDNKTDKISILKKNAMIKKRNKLKKLKNFLINFKKKLKIKKYNPKEFLTKKSFSKGNDFSIPNFNVKKGCLKDKNNKYKLTIVKDNQIKPFINCKTIDANNINYKNMENSLNEKTNFSQNNVDDSLIKDLEDLCNEEINFSFCSINQDKNFEINELSISKNINLEILSSYENLNEISNGKYLSDIDKQNDIKVNLQKHYFVDSNNEISLSLRSIEFSSDLAGSNLLKKNIRKKKNKNKKFKKSNKTEFTLKDESPKNNKKNKSPKKISKKNVKIKYFLKASKSQKIFNKEGKEDKIQITTEENPTCGTEIKNKKNSINPHSETKSNLKNTVKNDKNEIIYSGSNIKNISIFPTIKNINQLNVHDSIHVNKSDKNSSSFHEKEMNNNILKNNSLKINIKKDKHIHSKTETEYEIEKDINYNDSNENKKPIVNNINNKVSSINDKNSHIYKEKNHHFKKRNGNGKTKKKNNTKIINQIFPNTNIITNNITTISSNNIENKNIYNSNAKINNIESSFNINNHIQNNLNIINNEQNNSQNNLNKDFCYIF